MFRSTMAARERLFVASYLRPANHLDRNKAEQSCSGSQLFELLAAAATSGRHHSAGRRVVAGGVNVSPLRHSFAKLTPPPPPNPL